MRWINLRLVIIIIAFLSIPVLGVSQNKLKVMVIFAHPDEGEIYAGGITTLYTQRGHEVKFISLTNGDAGHYAIQAKELAERRYREAMHAKEILSLSEYEIAEYGRQISNEDVFELFPMLGRVYMVSGKSDWLDTGIDVMEGQKLVIESTGQILWNLKDRKYCDPDGAAPYTRGVNRPMPGAGSGALIGKIGLDSGGFFLIGTNSEIDAFKSGRLYLGINDDNTQDNEGFYRIRIQ